MSAIVITPADVRTAADHPLPDTHHLDAPREIHAELTRAVLARNLAEARVEPESPERRHDPTGQALEARADVERRIRVGGGPGEGEGRLEERPPHGRPPSRTTGSKPAARASSSARRIAGPPGVETREEQRVVRAVEAQAVGRITASDTSEHRVGDGRVEHGSAGEAIAVEQHGAAGLFLLGGEWR